ncbi:MAG: AMP-binding protein [Hyphomicrobium sp.]
MTEHPPDSFNMAHYCIGAAARERPGHPALLVYNVPDAREAVENWSFADIERGVLQLAASLQRLGLAPGDRIAIHLGNHSWSALLFFAAIAGGFVALPLSDQLTLRELNGLLEDSGASAIATADASLVNQIPSGVRLLTADDVDAMFWDDATSSYCGRPSGYAATKFDDPAFLIYTSGTTATPKGVLHAQRSAWGRRPMHQGWQGIAADDRMLHAGSFNWTYTLGVGLTDPWANGATAIVYTGAKTPELWPGFIRAAGATLFAAVPSLYRQILKYAPAGPIDLGALRHGLVAGERPPDELFGEWERRTGTKLYEALGMSEISTYISTSPSTPRRPGAVGKPQPGRRIAILPVDWGETPLPANTEGLVAVHRSDPGLMLGYWRRPDEDAAATRGDWFIGGDLGRMDADGYVMHLGRADDVMNALGYRVSPQEIEAALAACPGVADVACAEIRVRSDLSVIGAFVIAAPGASLDAETVLAFAATNLADYKRPREVIFVESLPRTANGKVRRSALAAMRREPAQNRA